MAQISDDCFAFGGALMRADEALRIIADKVVCVVPREGRPLRACRDRILAADVVSSRDVPPHDNAAVDGYAVAFDDLATDGDTYLPVTARVAAGQHLGRDARRGEAIRIFTGAPVPAGVDTVFMQEDAQETDAMVRLPPGIRRGANRRRRGEDILAGSTILTAGRRLRPQDIGLAASIGVATLPVYARLKVAVLSSGDELVEPADATRTGQVFDANRYALIALIEGLGCETIDLGIVPDRPDAVEEALARASTQADAIVTSGGMSTGEEDHMRSAVSRLGALNFWRLAIRPGRPLALGQVKGKPFVGLPGNPVAMMVTFMRFARPLLLGLAGATTRPPQVFPVRMIEPIRKKLGRREWLRVSLERAADGTLGAKKFPRDGAGILTALVASDGLVELAEELTDVPAGTMVDFIPFSEVDV